MTSDGRLRPHWSFWVIGALALIWNVGGVANYVMQVTDAAVLDSYRASERAIIESRPAWATGAFALAVFGGGLGCVLLLFRKSAAIWVLIMSLLGVAVTQFYALSVGIAFSMGEIAGIILTPLLLPVVLIFYAKYAERRRWIG